MNLVLRLKVFRLMYTSVDSAFRGIWIFLVSCSAILLFMLIETDGRPLFMAASPVLPAGDVAGYY